MNGFQRKIQSASAEKRVSFDVLSIDEPPKTEVESNEAESEQLKLSAIPVNDFLTSDGNE